MAVGRGMGRGFASRPRLQQGCHKRIAYRVLPATAFALLSIASLAASPAAQAQATTSGLPAAQTTPELPAAPAPVTSTSSSTLNLGASAGSTGVGSALGGSTGGGNPIQVPTQSSLFNPYLGSLQAAPATPQVIPLALDDAFRMGIANNLGLVYSRQAQQQQYSQRLQVLNVLLPNIDVQGSTAYHEFNLEAEGFRPDALQQFASLLPPSLAKGFPFTVKVDVTQGQAVLSQYLFNLSGLDAVRAFSHLLKSTAETSASSRGTVVQNVGTAYLRVIAAQGQIAFDQSLLKTDQSVLYQSRQEHQAGILANLDELRARVQEQTEEQALIADQNTLAKAKIALNREIGLAPEQEISVADTSPFADLQAMTPEDAEREALALRQDYLSAIEQEQAAQEERKVATRERYPTLLFNGNYGVTGISGGVYHDTFAAVGTLQIPVFQEAKFRSDRDTADFQVQNARAQVGNLRSQIGQQVRGSLIDLRSYAASLALANSNLQLAQVALGQAVEQFQAGVEDNLPAITAASTLAQAQVESIYASFQYNQAKLNFAQNLGRLDVNFHPEWQGGRPAGVLSDRAAMGR